MLTWTLWRALQKPPLNHPLYQQALRRPASSLSPYLGCVIVLVAPFVLLPALIFLSGVYGLRWTMQIASAIAREHETGRFELVSLSPGGALGSSRAIMSACLHRNESLEQIQSAGAWVLRLAFAFTLMLSLTSLSDPILPNSSTEPNVNEIITIIYLVTMVAAIYIDHVQSIVVAQLVGMWLPTVVPRRLDASMGAFLIYLLLQISVYMLTALLAFSILPGLLSALPSPVNTLLLAFLRLIAFFALRESLIQWLWKTVVRQTNAAPSELEFMTR